MSELLATVETAVASPAQAAKKARKAKTLIAPTSGVSETASATAPKTPTDGGIKINPKIKTWRAELEELFPAGKPNADKIVKLTETIFQEFQGVLASQYSIGLHLIEIRNLIVSASPKDTLAKFLTKVTSRFGISTSTAKRYMDNALAVSEYFGDNLKLQTTLFSLTNLQGVIEPTTKALTAKAQAFIAENPKPTEKTSDVDMKRWCKAFASHCRTKVTSTASAREMSQSNAMVKKFGVYLTSVKGLTNKEWSKHAQDVIGVLDKMLGKLERAAKADGVLKPNYIKDAVTYGEESLKVIIDAYSRADISQPSPGGREDTLARQFPVEELTTA